MQSGGGEEESTAQPRSASRSKPSTDPSSYVGQLFGRFKVEAQLATEYGFYVFRAKHQRTSREVALKVLVPALAADKDAVELFLEDVRAAGTCGHPNIVEVLEVGRTPDGVPYVVTELVKGTSLQKLIEAGPLTVARALEIADQIAGALVTLHKATIAHGALSPNDVVIVGDAEVKLTEFGMSRFDVVKNVLADPEGPFARTIEYMAPEQIDDPSKVQPTGVDIYSLGATLYAMLAGASPFASYSIDDLLPAVVEAEPRKLREIRPELRVSVTKLVNRAMKKARDQRYASMQEMLDGLSALERDVPAMPISRPNLPAAHAAPPAPPSSSSAMAFARTEIASDELSAAAEQADASAALAPAPLVTAPTAVSPAPAAASPVPPAVAAPASPIPPPPSPYAAPAAAAVTRVSAREEEPARKRKAVWIWLAPVAIILGGAGFFAMRSTGGEPPQPSAQPPAVQTAKPTEPPAPSPTLAQTAPKPPTPAEVKPTNDPKPPADATPANAKIVADPRRLAPAPRPAPPPAPVAAIPGRPPQRVQPNVSAPPSQPAAASPTDAPPKKKPRTSADLEPY